MRPIVRKIASISIAAHLRSLLKKNRVECCRVDGCEVDGCTLIVVLKNWLEIVTLRAVKLRMTNAKAVKAKSTKARVEP